MTTTEPQGAVANPYAGGNAASVRRLADGIGFSEGPVVSPSGDVFVTSITHGRVYRIDDAGASVFGETGGGANGAALDGDGCLYIAQNGGRWASAGPRWKPDSVGGIQRIDPDGAVSWVTREPIAPNDLCFGPDGLLYVTDPTRAPRDAGGPADGRIWRIDPSDGATELLCSVRWFPNGIAFGADDRLYVAATDTASIVRLDLPGNGIVDETPVIQMERGMPDGIAFDASGNLVVSAIEDEGGVGTIQTWSLDGVLLDIFAPGPHRAYANIAFAPDRSMVIADSDGGGVLLAEDWPVGGLALHPFR